MIEKVRRQGDYLFLCIVLLLALAIRLDFLWANNFVIDSDEAIVGLMARHIVEGGEIPAFYYGQHYMGSLEALVTAGVFSVFGPSAIGLKCVPLAFSLVLVVLVYLLTKEVAGKTAARIAALVAAIPPSALVIWSAMARGGFIELVVIGAAAFLALLKWVKGEWPFARGGLAGIFVTGLLLGLGWWVNNQIVYFMLPAGFAVLAVLLETAKGRGIIFLGKKLVQWAMAGFVGFFVGGLPFWLYNFEHQFISFKMFTGSSTGDAWDHLQGVFSVALPILLGAKRFWQVENIFPSSTALVWIVYLAMLGALIVIRRRELLRLFTFRIDKDHPIEVFLLFLFACIAVFSLSSFGWLVEAPRYLLPMYVGIFVLTGVMLEYCWNKSRVLGLGLVALFLSLNLLSSYYHGRAIPGEPYIFKGERVSKDQTALINWLKEHNVHWVRTNYWIGYRLAFETKEAVRFLVYQAPWQTRIESYRKEASPLDQNSMPFVLVPAQAEIIRKGLEISGFSFKEESLSGYAVLYDLNPKQEGLRDIDKSVLSAFANYHIEAAPLAIDGDVTTRWGSAHPQVPGMEFDIALNPPQDLRGLVYEFGEWPHDYPRKLSVQLELSDGGVQELFNSEGWETIRYLVQGGLPTSFYFNPVKVKRVVLRQEGSVPILDWSIAELRLLQ